jgi:hypothetical protein
VQTGSAYSTGKVIDPARLTDLLHDVIRSGDRVALEGDKPEAGGLPLSHAGRLRSNANQQAAQADLDDLAQAVAHPVQWYDATRLMGELGVTCAIETPPGHVLTRLLASAVPSAVAFSLEDNGFAATARRTGDPRHRSD